MGIYVVVIPPEEEKVERGKREKGGIGVENCYHEKNGTFLSEKNRQPIFLDRPSYGHDIVSVIIDFGTRSSKNRKRLLAIFDVVESIVEGLVSLLRRSSE